MNDKITKTILETYNKFKSGKTINEIAIERKIKEVSIEDHLCKLYENNYDIEIEKLDYDYMTFLEIKLNLIYLF